jgi:TonB family protein
LHRSESVFWILAITLPGGSVVTNSVLAVATIALLVPAMQPQQAGTQSQSITFRVAPVDALSKLIVLDNFPKWNSSKPMMGAFEIFVDASGKTTKVLPYPTSPETELQALTAIAEQLAFHPLQYQGASVPFVSVLAVCTDPAYGTFPCAPKLNAIRGVDDPIPQRLRFAGCEDPKTGKKCQGVAPIGKLKIGGANPRYPAEAKSAGVVGTVVVRVVVSTAGKVLSLRVLGGPPMLYQSATDALRTWEYKPLTWNGTPVEMEFNAVIDYKLGLGTSGLQSLE